MGTLKQAVDRVTAAKTAIGNAITAKGGTVSQDDGLEDFAADIGTITNQYTAGDEGKVVSNGALVAQTAYPTTITENGTYNTTENNSVTVNVAASGNIAYKLSGANANDIYIIECDDYIYIFGASIYTAGSAVYQFQYTIPNGFDTSKIGTLIGGALKGGNYDLNLPGGSGSVTVSGNNLTLRFTTTSFSPNINIWTLARISKAVSP